MAASVDTIRPAEVTRNSIPPISSEQFAKIIDGKLVNLVRNNFDGFSVVERKGLQNPKPNSVFQEQGSRVGVHGENVYAVILGGESNQDSLQRSFLLDSKIELAVMKGESPWSLRVSKKGYIEALRFNGPANVFIPNEGKHLGNISQNGDTSSQFINLQPAANFARRLQEQETGEGGAVNDERERAGALAAVRLRKENLIERIEKIRVQAAAMRNGRAGDVDSAQSGDASASEEEAATSTGSGISASAPEVVTDSPGRKRLANERPWGLFYDDEIVGSNNAQMMAGGHDGGWKPRIVKSRVPRTTKVFDWENNI